MSIHDRSTVADWFFPRLIPNVCATRRASIRRPIDSPDPNLAQPDRQPGRSVTTFGVDLEVPPQFLAGFAAAEAVGSQREQSAGDPGADLLGQHPHIVRGRNKRALVAGQLRFEERLPRFLGRMEHVPTFGRFAVAGQLRVTGHAPGVAGHAVLVGQDLLCPQHFAQNRLPMPNSCTRGPPAAASFEPTL